MVGNQIPFLKLEVLQLENLFILTSIYYTALPFPNLKKIRVISCSKLWKLPLESNKCKGRKARYRGIGVMVAMPRMGR